MFSFRSSWSWPNTTTPIPQRCWRARCGGRTNLGCLYVTPGRGLVLVVFSPATSFHLTAQVPFTEPPSCDCWVVQGWNRAPSQTKHQQAAHSERKEVLRGLSGHLLKQILYQHGTGQHGRLSPIWGGVKSDWQSFLYLAELMLANKRPISSFFMVLHSQWFNLYSVSKHVRLISCLFGVWPYKNGKKEI